MLLTLIALCTVLASMKPPYSQLAVLKSLTKLGNHLHYTHIGSALIGIPFCIRMYVYYVFMQLRTKHDFSLISMILCIAIYYIDLQLQGVSLQYDH